MVQPRVEWSIVGSAVRRSAIGLRVSYISSLSLSLSRGRKNTQALPHRLSSYREQQWTRGARCVLAAGILPCYTTVAVHCPALFALCRVSNPPTLLSTTTREMVIRYGLEVARDISLLNDTALLSSFLSPFPTRLHPVLFSVREISR